MLDPLSSDAASIFGKSEAPARKPPRFYQVYEWAHQVGERKDYRALRARNYHPAIPCII